MAGIGLIHNPNAKINKNQPELAEKLAGLLTSTNIVIASAATHDYLFKKNSLKKIMARHRAGSLLIIDIAVPQNFEPSVNEIVPLLPMIFLARLMIP